MTENSIREVHTESPLHHNLVDGTLSLWREPEGAPSITTDFFLARIKGIVDLRKDTHAAVPPPTISKKSMIWAYPFHEVRLRFSRIVDDITDHDTIMEEGIKDERWYPEILKVEGGRSGYAYNLAEQYHGDNQHDTTEVDPELICIAHLIYGIDMNNYYYPADFRPMPPGQWFARDLVNRFYLTRQRVLVRMQEYTDDENVTGYTFDRMGTHDGGCSIPGPDDNVCSLLPSTIHLPDY